MLDIGRTYLAYIYPVSSNQHPESLAYIYPVSSNQYPGSLFKVPKQFLSLPHYLKE
jgi:hypothetical protein